MKRFSVAVFCSFVFAISLYGIAFPSYYLALIMNSTMPYLAVRALLVLALLTYTFLPAFRQTLTQNILKASGLMLLAFGLTSLYSANIFGLLEANVLIGDIALFMEGGILAIVLGVELPASTYSVTTRSHLYLQRLAEQSAIPITSKRSSNIRTLTT